ncbi:MAG TPA: isoprenylcysteine carboxylmethyltransferase family protein [Bryobacteraceae bacterium]|nr:isoprenylcysteine carboxylmethyltransferase family protein [Bryobacteraceae bacterium]
MMHRYIDWIWIATGIVWMLGSMNVKRAERVERLGPRAIHMVMMTAAFALLFWPRLSAGLLAWRFVPESPAIEWTGLAVTAAGCAFAIWARLMLGRNWSGRVTIKQDHRLVRRGPYAIVRHPIYTGGLLALAGTALAFGELRCLFGCALVFIGWYAKSRREEAFMVAQFGDEYVQYRREVKALIPFVV